LERSSSFLITEVTPLGFRSKSGSFGSSEGVGVGVGVGVGPGEGEMGWREGDPSEGRMGDTEGKGVEGSCTLGSSEGAGELREDSPSLSRGGFLAHAAKRERQVIRARSRLIVFRLVFINDTVLSFRKAVLSFEGVFIRWC
jgi:hypothetical protein